VSGGIGRRIRPPSFCGLSPSSEVRIAFSISWMSARSQGWMVIMRGSGTLTLATCFTGTIDP
jgi:hypothetical protein